MVFISPINLCITSAGPVVRLLTLWEELVREMHVSLPHGHII